MVSCIHGRISRTLLSVHLGHISVQVSWPYQLQIHISLQLTWSHASQQQPCLKTLLTGIISAGLCRLVTAGLMLGGPEMLDPGMEDAGEGILVISLISGLLVGALAGFLWLL